VLRVKLSASETLIKSSKSKLQLYNCWGISSLPSLKADAAAIKIDIASGPKKTGPFLKVCHLTTHKSDLYVKMFSTLSEVRLSS